MNLSLYVVCVAVVTLGIIVVGFTACNAEGGSSIDKPSMSTQTSSPVAISTALPTATPPPLPQPTSTPVPTFQPTAGMLAFAPIGRMPMECWVKEAEVDSRPFITSFCEAKDSYRKLYIDGSGWRDTPEESVTVYLIYFKEAGTDRVDLIECGGLVFTKETMGKSRGETLPGTCSRYLEFRRAAELLIARAISRWTAYSGLAKPATREEFEIILEVLKR